MAIEQVTSEIYHVKSPNHKTLVIDIKNIHTRLMALEENTLVKEGRESYVFPSIIVDVTLLKPDAQIEKYDNQDICTLDVFAIVGENDGRGKDRVSKTVKKLMGSFFAWDDVIIEDSFENAYQYIIRD